jgi:SpoVK/Ycf46/Vps4 family AAA+-type ATPase
MTELRLLETIHPTRDGMKEFDGLFGIDAIKEALIDELALILDARRLESWIERHHAKGLGILDIGRSTVPLILLSGDVGCGKTALASCVATPVARAIGQRIVCLETPSDIRGGGHVGELSARITEAFTQAKARAAAVGRGILVIDEADDLATGRNQMQAHHEDRAGVNVLIKEINQLAASAAPVALIMITNRADVLDPAVLRRAALRLTFERPNGKARFTLFQRLLQGTGATEAEIAELARLTEHNTGYTYSDLTSRIGRLALRRAWKSDQPSGFGALKAAIAEIEPSPAMTAGWGTAHG